MSTSVSNKKIRTEQFNNIQDSKNSLQKLPASIIYSISMYLNIVDASRMTGACRAFKLIPLYFFRGSLNQMQIIFDRCCIVERKKYGLDAFSEPWRLGFEGALPILPEFELHGSAWETDKEFYVKTPKNQIEKILSLTTSLNKLRLFYCSEKILKLTTAFNLTELDISINYNLDFSVLSKSLKKLSIESNQEILSIINFNNKTQPLPDLETLAITTEAHNAILDEDFTIFVTNLVSLKKLRIISHQLVVNSQNLKNLKELTLRFNDHEVFVKNTTNLPNSLEILTIEEVAFKSLSLQPFRDKIISLENLKKVNFIFSDTTDLQKLHNLVLSRIASLDKVYIRFNQTLSLSKYELDYDIKHLSLAAYNVSEAALLNDFDIQLANIEELEIICSANNTQRKASIFNLSYDEYCFISGLDFLSDKITSLSEEEDFEWTKPMLDQLKRKPLVKCTAFKGRFICDKKPAPTTELFALFPALIPEKVERIWEE